MTEIKWWHRLWNKLFPSMRIITQDEAVRIIDEELEKDDADIDNDVLDPPFDALGEAFRRGWQNYCVIRRRR